MKAFKAILWILFIFSILYISYFYRSALSVEVIEQWLAQFGIASPLFFIALYALLVVLGFPGSVLTLAGGFLFGLWWGTLLNLIAATMGATISFLIARYLAADWIAQNTKGMLARLIDGVQREGWRFVMVVRLVPLFPFNILNYALGLTPLRLFDYIWASFVFMSPGCFGYTYLGTLGKSALTEEKSVLISRSLIGLGIIVLLLAIPYFVKRWRNHEKK